MADMIMKTIRLSNVIDIISGGTPKTTNPEYWNGNIGWLSVADFNNDARFVYDSEKTITERGLNESSTKLLNIGDTIISARGTVGGLSQIGKPMAFNQSCFGLRAKKGIINEDFLYYILKNYIRNLKAKSQGSIFDSINLTTFDMIELSIPNLKTQQKIAKILSDLDDKIELLNQINDNLAQLAKTIYDYWFVQFDFPDENGKPYKTSGGKMVYNEILKREIPEGWEVKNLFEVANITMGQSPQGSSYNENKEGIVFFQGSTDFGWRFPLKRVYTTEPTRLAEKNDILLSVRAPIGVMNLAMEKCCIGRGLSAINSKDKFKSFLIYQMEYFKQKFDYLNSVGTTFGSLTKDDLFNLILAYPQKNTLFAFEEKVNFLDVKMNINQQQIQHLQSLRDWLLPMLMNGQVEVE